MYQCTIDVFYNNNLSQVIIYPFVVMDAWTSHPRLRAWITSQIELCKPAKVHFCTGSVSEYETLMDEMVKAGVMIPLNAEKYPNCYLARSAKEDVARVENRTYICSAKREDAGPTNNGKTLKS